MTGAQVFLTFEGTEPGARLVGVDQAETLANYFIGDDPRQWASHVPTWSRVRYEGLYPGIDVDVHGAPGRPEYDVIVAPAADLGAVVVRVDGADGLSLRPDGTLRIETAAGPLLQAPARTWEQDRNGSVRPIGCRYRLLDATHYGFEVAGRDYTRRLIVDPSLVYSTLLGGSGIDQALAVAVDGTGAAVAVGATVGATDFPVTPGAFSTVAGDTYNGFVAKLTSTGAALEFATFLGSSPAAPDNVSCVSLAASDDICVAGFAGASNFPTTSGAFDTTYNGAGDMFVTRLSADGSALVYSTFIGGTDGEGPEGIALDSQERVCLVGGSISSDFPVSPNAYQSVRSLYATVVARLSADGSALEYASYLDGAAEPYGIALDGDGRVHFVGVGDQLLAVTPGALDVTAQFGEGFVATMDCDAGTLDYASFLGGGFNDFCFGIAVDARGSRYVVGSTESFDFPVTSGSFDSTLNGNYDAFVVKLSPNGSTVEWGTFMGGGGFGSDEADNLALLSDGSVCVVGQAGSPNFPVTPDAYDSAYNNHTALFISRLSADGSTLLYSSFFGGTTGPVNYPSIALDVTGAIYVGGADSDAQFPVTPGAFDSVFDGPDAYVLKFSFTPWSDVGHGLAGTGGLTPFVTGSGPLEPGSAGSIELMNAEPSSPAYLLVGLAHLDAAFKGGTMVPNPLLLLPLTTNASGGLTLSWLHWPAGLPAGTELLVQYWIVDPGGPVGFSASNGLSAVMPGGVP